MSGISSGEQPVRPPVKKINRRQFLRLTATFGAEAVLAGCSANPLATLFGKAKPTVAEPAPTHLSPKAAETPLAPKTASESSPVKSKEVQSYQEIAVEGLTFLVDEDGLPFAYRMPDGKITNFDIRELNQCRERAISQKEIELFCSIPIPKQKEDEKLPLKEHPVLDMPPKDTLTAQEIARYGIEIMQAEKIQLYIRKTAFKPGAQLERYEKGDKLLKIVLLDAPFIADIFLKEPKYAQIKAICKDSKFPSLPEQTRDVMNAFRLRKKAQMEQLLVESRQKIKNGTGNHTEIELEILDVKASLYAYQHANDDELYWEMLAELLESAPTGAHTIIVPTGIPRKGEKAEEYSLIVVPVGEGKEIPASVSIACGADGDFKIQVYPRIPLFYSRSPQAGQSFPDPSQLRLSKRGSYKYDDTNPGFAFRHEVEHDIDREGELDEYKTDEAAASALDHAFKLWREKGDDSEYCFVFRLANGRYILTERDSPTST